MTAHSRIGASSMHRWGECPGSVKLSEGVENKSSVYAEEGTVAHGHGAKLLAGEEVECDDPEMIEAVQVYVKAVHDFIKASGDRNAVLHIERRFDLSKVHPGLFGTADAVVYIPSQRLLRVYDYKHGAGIAVDAKENEQLQYYGLGALLSFPEYRVETVELVIVQPRCMHPDGPVRSWAFPALEILDFAATLVEKAKATEEPNAPLKPGDHCRFCPAAGFCPQIHQKAMVLAKEEFTPLLSYDPEKLASTLKLLPMVEAWAKSVREFAYGEAMHGRVPPGFKLVEKRATRRWINEEQAAEEISARFKIPTSLLYDLKLKSPAGVEKLVSKKFKDRLQDLIVAQSSGYSLVDSGDKREAAKLDAASEFTSLPNEVEQLAPEFV